MSNQLITPRLILKPLSLEDAPFMMRILNSENWLKFIGDRNVHSIEDAEGYLKKWSLMCLEKYGFGYYLMSLADSGIPIGTCGLGKREGLVAADFGFAILPEFERQGYTYEASLAIIQEAKTTFNIPHLLAITTEVNIGSRSLLEKLEFTFDEEVFLPDNPTTFWQYSLRY